MSKNGYYSKELKIKSGALPVDDITKFAYDDSDYEEVEVWHEYTGEELDKIKQREDRQEKEEIFNSLPDALADLSSEVSNNSISVNDLMDAIADLSSVVSDLSAKVDSNG
nr:MAG TPA: hypothetical protein [Caudoviricetes sp.]